MDYFIISEFLKTSGEILIGLTAIMVHRRVWKEHKIDEAVYREMKQEQGLGIVGIMLLLGGFMVDILRVTHYL